MSDRLWVITAYFNWCHYKSKRYNYELFTRNLVMAGVNLITVECALTGVPFELTGKNIIHVNTSSILWQKERLLNIAIANLPPECQYVAWLDCDLLIDVAAWERNIIALLDEFAVIQLFDTVYRQANGEPFYSPQTRKVRGFVALRAITPPGPALFLQGHPGFAWAARREIVSRSGLYDKGIIGGSDRLMALAWTGNLDAEIIEKTIPVHARPHFAEWAEASFKRTQCSVGYLPGTIFHLWHGEHEHRLYNERHEALKQFDFDPSADIRVNEDGCWEWSSDKVDLHQWVSTYFANRREDG